MQNPEPHIYCRTWPRLRGFVIHCRICDSRRQSACRWQSDGRSPAVILPRNWTEWDDWKLRAVLVHELAHIRRGDWLVAMAACIGRCVFWFHPLAWWLERHLATLAEQSSDDGALESTGDAARYASTILEFASALHAGGRRVTQIGVAMARSARVGRRIERVLELRRPGSGFVKRSAWIAILASALPFIYGAAAFQFEPRAPERSKALRESDDLNKRMMTALFNLPATKASELERRLAQNPEDLEARVGLIGYYLVNGMALKRLENILWLIEHHPESDLALSLQARLTPIDGPDNNPADFERAKTSWMAQAAAHPDDARVLAHAGDFLWESDPFVADELHTRARQVEPANALLTNRQAEWMRLIIDYSVPPPGAEPYSWANPAFAAAARKKLETSMDSALVGMVGQRLAWSVEMDKNAVNALKSGFPETMRARAEFAEMLLKRAQSLDPGNPEWPEALRTLRLAGEGKSLESSQGPSPDKRLPIGSAVVESNLLRHVPPEYPALARQVRLQGIVRLRVSINAEGHVSKMENAMGHPLLVKAARAAVEQWVFRPTLKNGIPVEAVTDVEVPFKLEETN